MWVRVRPRKLVVITEYYTRRQWSGRGLRYNLVRRSDHSKVFYIASWYLTGIIDSAPSTCLAVLHHHGPIGCQFGELSILSRTLDHRLQSRTAAGGIDDYHVDLGLLSPESILRRSSGLFLVIVISVHENTYPQNVSHPKSDSRPSRRIGGFEKIKAEGVGCSSAYSSDSLGEWHGNRATIEKDF